MREWKNWAPFCKPLISNALRYGFQKFNYIFIQPFLYVYTTAADDQKVLFFPNPFQKKSAHRPSPYQQNRDSSYVA